MPKSDPESPLSPVVKNSVLSFNVYIGIYFYSIGIFSGVILPEHCKLMEKMLMERVRMTGWFDKVYCI